VLSVATLGIYAIIWYYKVNREMRDFGSVNRESDLASTKPWASLLGFTLGGFVTIPRLVTLVRTVSRIQAVERIATGSARPAAVLRAGVVTAALLPIGASVHRVGALFAVAALLALAASITAMQARLNAAWRAHGAETAARAQMGAPAA
jgi:hypothetical protein